MTHYLYRVSTLADPIAADRELLVDRPRWAVMRARPNFKEHGQVLWADLLAALGHDLDSTERGRAISNGDLLALCWLAAGNIDNLVVAGANMLPPTSLRELCAATTSQAIRTWLLYDIEPTDEREEAEISLAPVSVDLDGFLKVRLDAGMASTREHDEPFPTVPDTHFLGFLDMSAQLLSAEDFIRVTHCFNFGKAEMLARLDDSPDIDEEGLARCLHEITNHTNDINQLTPIIKGAQVGAFTRGWHLKIDVGRWAQRGMVAALRRHLEPFEWEKLSRLYRPCEAATCALSTIGVGTDELANLAATAVSQDGRSIHHRNEDIEVPELARPLLVAQHIFRDLVGSDSERFLIQSQSSGEISTTWAGALLKRVSRDTGVLLRTSSASRKSMEKASWTHRLGVMVTRLAS